MVTRDIVLFVIIFSVLVYNVHCEKRQNKKKNRAKPSAAKEVDPDVFLEKFGYLGQPPSGVAHSPESRRAAIKNFQRMVGLNVTGKLDKVTRKKMGAPRCGMPDMVPPGTNLPPPGVALEPGDKPLTYYVPGYKWEKKSLTWSVENYSPDMNQGSQRRAFRNALKQWSDVTSLTFNEVSRDGDFTIGFSRYDHGDGSPFDGESGTLAHAFYPEDGRCHFDEDELWTEDTDEGINLEIVAAHEFGHAIGLGHSNVRGALMAPYYQGYEANYQLPEDDIMAAQSLYGSNTARPTTSRPTPRPTPRPTDGTRPTEGSSDDKDTCTTKFGAVMHAHDSRIYVFNSKWMWRLNDWGVDPGYPQRLTKVFPGAPYSIGAAVYSWRSRYTYFFKGTRVWQFYGFTRTKKKTMKSSNYPPGVQAALIGRDGRIYLMKGSEYWTFDEATFDVTGPGRPISSLWPGLPPNLEAAVRLRDGYLYFFKGSKYRKYDEYYKRVVEGYPKYKAGPWMGGECGGGQYQPK